MTLPTAEEKAGYVRAMFGRIAGRYDLLNDLMTAGQHRRWKRLAVRAAKPGGARALDLGCGTGDLSRELARQGATFVVGGDFVPEMLAVARDKSGRPHRVASEMSCPNADPGVPESMGADRAYAIRPYGGGGAGGARRSIGQRMVRFPTTRRTEAAAREVATVVFTAADAMRLPFADATFDCVTSGFLVRNVVDAEGAFREMRRVLKPGGRVVCLEASRRDDRLGRVLHWGFGVVARVLGRVVAGDADAYGYLPDSAAAFAGPRALAAVMARAGFSKVQYRRLGLGMIAVHRGVRE